MTKRKGKENFENQIEETWKLKNENRLMDMSKSLMRTRHPLSFRTRIAGTGCVLVYLFAHLPIFML